MGLDIIRRCGIVRSGLVAILTGLVGACADQSEPAPVFQRGAADQVTAPMSAPSSSALQVTVRRGQTLGGYAYTYHVSKSAIIAANGLQPPYELKIGQRLTIPVSGRSAPVRTAAAAPYVTPPGVSPSSVRSEALPPPAQPVATPQPPPVPQTLSPPPAAAKAQPEVISLDGPPPKESAAAQPPAPASQRLAQATLTPPPSAAAPMTAGPAVTSPPPPTQSQTSTDSGTAGGRFPWPVRGRILANYGNTAGGGHNDGINIGAPRGTPVRAIDGGTVAYVGNEVKGYGNTVLIRHANGWISAYAHLDDIGVNSGETITAGQVIAKVGDSGGAPEPQLHFELRRGKQPVNPREFLAPAPSASASGGNMAG